MVVSAKVRSLNSSTAASSNRSGSLAASSAESRPGPPRLLAAFLFVISTLYKKLADLGRLAVDLKKRNCFFPSRQRKRNIFFSLPRGDRHDRHHHRLRCVPGRRNQARERKVA